MDTIFPVFDAKDSIKNTGFGSAVCVSLSGLFGLMVLLNSSRYFLIPTAVFIFATLFLNCLLMDNFFYIPITITEVPESFKYKLEEPKPLCLNKDEKLEFGSPDLPDCVAEDGDKIEQYQKARNFSEKMKLVRFREYRNINIIRIVLSILLVTTMLVCYSIIQISRCAHGKDAKPQHTKKIYRNGHSDQSDRRKRNDHRLRRNQSDLSYQSFESDEIYWENQRYNSDMHSLPEKPKTN